MAGTWLYMRLKNSSSNERGIVAESASVHRLPFPSSVCNYAQGFPQGAVDRQSYSIYISAGFHSYGTPRNSSTRKSALTKIPNGISFQSTRPQSTLCLSRLSTSPQTSVPPRRFRPRLYKPTEPLSCLWPPGLHQLRGPLEGALQGNTPILFCSLSRRRIHSLA